jgi:aminoglycoside 6'-N-acetyltransferase
MPNQIIFRCATINDLPLLKHWDEQPHVIASGGEDNDWEWESYLPQNPSWREALIAELDERPIGFVQIIDAHEEETHYWGAIAPGTYAIDIWIGEAEDLGQGYGTVMMRKALARCFAHPTVHTVVIDPLESNVRAHRFYERQGFVFLEKRRFDEDECLVYHCTRKAWEAQLPESTSIRED